MLKKVFVVLFYDVIDRKLLKVWFTIMYDKLHRWRLCLQATPDTLSLTHIQCLLFIPFLVDLI